MNTMPWSRWMPAFVLLSFVACQPPGEQGPATLSDEDVSAIESASDAWQDAAQNGDWEALAAVYTEDAVLLPPNHPPVEGSSAIADHFASYPPISEVRLDPVEIEGRGDLAYVYGTYTMTVAPEGTDPVDDAGKYIEIRRKQADGQWLIALDIYNSDLFAPGGADEGEAEAEDGGEGS